MKKNGFNERRYYSEKEKDVIVQKLLVSRLSLNRFSKELGLLPNTVSNWVKKRGIEYESPAFLVPSDCETISNEEPTEAPALLGCGGLSSPPYVCIEENMNSTEKRLFELENKLRELKEENESLRNRCSVAETRAEKAEVGLFAMETLAEIAKEEYGIDLKNFGR